MTITEALNYQSQIVAEQVSWARDVKGIANLALLDAYKAGVLAGCQQMRAALTLHGALKLSDPKVHA